MRKRPNLPQFLQEPPDGMWYEASTSPLKPFRARWRAADGKKESRGFASAKERAQFAEQWLEQRAEFGRAAAVIDTDRAALWRQFDEMTGGANPVEVARWWVKVRGSVGGGIATAEAVKRYLALRATQPGARDTANHRRLHLTRLSAHFKERRLGQITADDIRAWLVGLTSRRLGGAPLSEGSRRHHYLSANQFFSHAVREGWLERSPMIAVDAPEWGTRDDVGVLTLDQMRALFSANAREPVAARLALEAFGGLRASSAGRLLASHVVWHSCGVELPASLHKSERRHFVDGQPGNLWRWLGHFAFTPAAWAMSERTYALEKSRAFARAQIATPPHNCLRHSFATYHLAAFKDPGRTAVLMQHRRSPEILWRHYVGKATQADGLAYFEILPPALAPAG